MKKIMKTLAESNTKETVLRIAFTEFATHGFEATSLTTILKKAKLAKGGFYYHFASKEELLFEIIEYMHSCLKIPSKGEQLTASQLKKRLLDLGTQVITLTKKNPQFEQLGWELATLSRTNPKLAQALKKKGDVQMNQLHQVIQEGIRLKIFKPQYDPQLILARIVFTLKASTLFLSFDVHSFNYEKIWKQTVQELLR